MLHVSSSVGLLRMQIADHSKYETITEDDILHILQEMMLSREEFQTLLEKVELLSPN